MSSETIGLTGCRHVNRRRVDRRAQITVKQADDDETLADLPEAHFIIGARQTRSRLVMMMMMMMVLMIMLIFTLKPGRGTPIHAANRVASARPDGSGRRRRIRRHRIKDSLAKHRELGTSVRMQDTHTHSFTHSNAKRLTRRSGRQGKRAPARHKNRLRNQSVTAATSVTCETVRWRTIKRLRT